jgi:hypothetical protein
MKRAVLFLVLVFLFVGSVPVLADGMFYWPESIPPEIPYQRALLLFEGGYETLIVQSKYHMSSSATSEFGWVVPVPSVPEMASVEPDLAEWLFWELASNSQPAVTDLPRSLGNLLGVICLFIVPASGFVLLLCGVSFLTNRLGFIRRRREAVAVAAAFLFTASLGVLMILALYATWFMPPSATSTIEVLTEEQVGIYEVQVVKAGEAGDLIQWLNENRFQFDKEDTQVFDEYLRRGWCFVVARVDPTRHMDAKILTEGPVYPLALTATAGNDTQVLLYVLSKHKWENDGRLRLEYAGGASLGLLEDVCRGASPGLAAACLDDTLLPYLCKFKGTLTPAQMEQDLVLTPAEDDESYRKHIIKW